ncbi:hypothetical protein [Winogradskyella forsetii]|uniref:hypothetical protein n=1 Tax=Winogradskyella forsetii TaxID=2686077 RepID=UPI0015C123F1|nr:hypothetical protein [Winogradskyella forsetii]
MKLKYSFLILILILTFSCKDSKVDEPNKNTMLEIEQRKNDSIAKIEKQKAELKKQNAEVLNNVGISNVDLKCRGNGTRAASVYGSGVTIYFTVENKTDIGINRIYFQGEYAFAGRSYVHKEEINYEFRKGLEPGESQKIAMRPGMLSKWNDKINPGDKGNLTLNVLKLEDYNGNFIGED